MRANIRLSQKKKRERFHLFITYYSLLVLSLLETQSYKVEDILLLLKTLQASKNETTNWKV